MACWTSLALLPNCDQGVLGPQPSRFEFEACWGHAALRTARLPHVTGCTHTSTQD